MFNSLIDTGATHSFIDIEIAKSLNLSILPSNGIIDLASTSHSLPSPGVTTITFIPVIVQDEMRLLSPMTHPFELMDLPRHKHQFIVGRDLLRPIFGRDIPMSLLPPDSPESSSPSLHWTLSLHPHHVSSTLLSLAHHYHLLLLKS